ncbi:MAG: hypothetical protein JWQ38_2148 [Flavipsychrobacter sp.]|nr:hypothetical protein [Flavipsychrobacter sp.]
MAIDQEMIFDRISEGKCILITGPDIGITDPNQTMHLKLKQYLIENYDADLKHYTDDEFFSFRDAGDKEGAIYKLQKFYKTLKPNDTYLKIADIPFHLIISVSPDHILKDVFTEKKIPYTFDYYNKEQNPGPLEAPSQEKPLIYNLFGNIDKESSLIFTYDDLFDYLMKIFGDFKLPQLLHTQLKDARIILFMGFDFDKWYFKLLLRLLGLNEPQKTKGASNKDNTIKDHIKNFYISEFKVNFIESTEADILDNLHQLCMEKGILRSKSTPAAPVLFPIGPRDIHQLQMAWGK